MFTAENARGIVEIEHVGIGVGGRVGQSCPQFDKAEPLHLFLQVERLGGDKTHRYGGVEVAIALGWQGRRPVVAAGQLEEHIVVPAQVQEGENRVGPFAHQRFAGNHGAGRIAGDAHHHFALGIGVVGRRGEIVERVAVGEIPGPRMAADLVHVIVPAVGADGELHVKPFIQESFLACGQQPFEDVGIGPVKAVGIIPALDAERIDGFIFGDVLIEVEVAPHTPGDAEPGRDVVRKGQGADVLVALQRRVVVVVVPPQGRFDVEERVTLLGVLRPVGIGVVFAVDAFVAAGP